MVRNKEERKKNNNLMGRRFGIIVIVFAILFGVIAFRLFYIFAFNGEEYKKAALEQSQTGSVSIVSKRGDILDRNNVQLATSTKVYNLILDPKVILSNEDKFLEPTVSAIEQYFGISGNELKGKISDNSNSSYVVLKKELTFSEVEEFTKVKAESSNIRGVWLEDNYKRNYTYNTLASSVIGFTDGITGEYGIERQYDSDLKGTDGMEYSFVNSENSIETVRREPVDGNTVMLSLDYNIQAIVEKHIAASFEETKAKGVAAVIQNPNTGEIYAMADTGAFDCNDPRNLSYRYTPEQVAAMDDKQTIDALTEVWRNDCITKSYEPGSTFKPFTVAMGIEEDKVKTTDTFECLGSKQFFEGTVWAKTIYCYNRGGDGVHDVKGAIAKSCNISLAQMSEKIGVDLFTKYQSKFGFGQYTDIDLPNEMNCKSLMYTKDNMTILDLATNSFGQNFNVTMVQMSTAFCSLINGGNLYKPYVVKKIYNSNGELIKSNDKTLVAQTISPDTGNFVKECLREVVVNGTGQAASVEGYKIAGKTGTAQKYDKEEELYVISFLGFAPYDNPQVVCYVAIDEPETGDVSRYASELFSKIMTEVLSYMNISPDNAGK